MRAPLPIAIRYYRSLPNRTVAGYLLGTFLTFAAVGFVSDLLHGPVARPLDWLAALLSAVASGTIGVLFALGPMRSYRWFLPMAAVAMTLGLWGLDLLWQTRLAGLAGTPMAWDVVQRRLTLEGRLATVTLLLGFVLWVRFIRLEGIRQARLRAEMDLAQEIHVALAPPVQLNVEACEVRGSSTPSTEVGGDLVDAFEREGRLVACVADVSGHGVPAGTLMAMVRSALRLELARRERLEPLLSDLNRMLLDLHRPDRFVTLACLRLERDGTADYALAGHLPILCVRAGATVAQRLENSNPPLGVLADQPFAAGSLRVASGDLLAIFTDGLSEVRDEAGGEFGIERIEALLVEHADRPLAEIENRILAAVQTYGRRRDDQTLLLMRVKV